jgi:hypothetical protein
MRWAARVMRSVIVDFARRRRAERRGGGKAAVRLTTDIGAVSSGEPEVLRVHDALEEMAARDRRMAADQPAACRSRLRARASPPASAAP